MDCADYNAFAEYYDKLMHDVDYERLCEYILSLASKYGVTAPGIAADLGCGTGKMCRLLSNKGFDMIGIDISEDMLSAARQYSEDSEILYLNQDMTDFELYGTVSMITCLTDGVNHITDTRKLRRMFYWVHNYLDHNGVFIFDINSEEKLSGTLGSNVFYEINDDITYLWQNKYNPKNKICTFDLTFFMKNADGSYLRRDTVIKEKAYSQNDIIQFLKEAGFDKIKAYKKKDRIFFVCVRPGNS